MKKNYLLKLSLVFLMLVGAGAANAQDNSAAGIMGARLIVKTPANLLGTKRFTSAFNADGTGWAPQIPNVISDTVVKGVNFDGCTTLTNPSVIANKWALIMRGTCLFSDKAWNAQQAGAKGIIIVNNVPGGDAVGMAQGSHIGQINIPVLMVSNADGLAMSAALDAGQTVTIGLTTWGFGFANDVAIVPYSMPLPHAGAIPAAQLGTNANPVAPYNIYYGGFVANIGTTDATGVSLGADVTFTTGSTTTSVDHDSIAIGTIALTDSILGNFSSHIYTPSASSLGHYDFKYYTQMANTDEDAFDDSSSFTLYTTDSVFCKSRWNNDLGKPYTNGATKFASGAQLSWGPLFYINNPGYRAEKIQFGVNDGDTSKHSLVNQGTTFIYMYSWVDGSNGNPADSLIQNTELTPVGVAAKTFSTLDSNDVMTTADWNDISGQPNTHAHIDTKGWYWTVIDLGTALSLDLDVNQNYFSRMRAAHVNGQVEFTAPNFAGTADAINTSSTAVNDIPFFTTTSIDSLGLNSTTDLTPSVALYLSKNHFTSVKNVSAAHPELNIYPNPATDNLHVKLALKAVSKTVWFNIADGLGRSKMKVMKNNLQNDDITFSTANLAAGNYLISVLTDEGLMTLPFTVVGK